MGVIWDQEMFDRAYRMRVRAPGHPNQGAELGYSEEFARMQRRPDRAGYTEYEERAELISTLVDRGTRILVVGCGFGYLPHELTRIGLPARGVDSSDWIAARWSRNRPSGFMRSPLHADIRDPEAELANIDALVTESVLESYPDDDERESLLARCRELAQTVIHMVFDTELIEPLLSQSIEDWAHEDPEATWISIPRRQVHV